MTIVAINKKHQALINRFIKWDAKYNAIVNASDGDEGRAGEKAYNKAADIWHALPKREQANINKTTDTIGY